MADNQYKIELGVQLKEDDIQSQINDAQRTLKPIEIKVDAETKELTKTIKEALKSLSSGTKNALTLDTSKLEASLNDVTSTIREIKATIGTLDSGSNMKSLVSSINSISLALDKASDKFDGLLADLKSLSGKDFNLNFGITMGGSNPIGRNAAYGSKVRNETLPQLQKQAAELENYLKQYYKVADGFSATQKLIQGTNAGNGKANLYDLLPKMLDSTGSLSSQMTAMKEYIALIKEAASIRGGKIGDGVNSIVSGFSQSADQLVKDAQDIQTGAKETEESFNKLKQIFGGGSNLNIEGLSASLEPIITDLTEIREAVVNLSNGISLEGLTSSFDRLSDSIEKLVQNATKVKNVLGDGLGNTSTSMSDTNSSASFANNAINTAEQTGRKIGEAVEKSVQQSLNVDDVIDKQVADIMEKYSIAGEKGSDSFNKIKQALLECRTELEIIKNGNFSIDEEVFGTSAAVDKVTKAIAEQMRDVNNLGDEYVKLADYITEFNRKNSKIHIPDFIKQEQGDDYRSNKSGLGIAFTTGKGQDFADFITELNGNLGETISLTNGEADAFDELVRKVNLGREQRDALKKSEKRLYENLSTEEILEQNYINRNEIYDDVMSITSAVDAAEQKIAQSSTETANIVAQNEESKQQAYRETSGVVENLKTTLEAMRVDRSSIDAIIKDVEELGFTATDTSVKMKNGNFDITVNGIDSIGRAITEIRHLDNATGEISLVDRKISQSLVESDTFVKQQVQSVANLTNQINQLNRAANDQNVSRPIKDSEHLDTLSAKYKEIISAIQRMGDASSDSFVDERNNVKALISDFKSLVSEYKNAENVSTKMKGTDFASGLDIAKNDLEKFKAQAKDFPQITQTIENLDKAIEGVGDSASLNKFNDQLRVARSELAKIKSETSAANRNEKVGINVSGLESKIADLQRISPEIDKFETEIDGAKVSVQSLLNDLKQVKTQGDFSVVNSKWKAFSDAAKSAGIAITETAQKAKSIESIKIKLSDTGFNSFEQEVSRAHAEAEKLENSTVELEAALRRLDVAMAGVYSADQANDTQRLVAANEEYENALKKVYSQLKLNQQAEKDTFNAEMLQQKKASLSSDMEIWLKENTRATKDFGEEIRRLQASLDGLDDRGVKLAGQQFKNLTKQAQVMGKTGLTVFDKLKAKAKEYAAYLSAAELFMYAEQALREIFNTVKEIDTAMTGLYRVTDLTSAEYDTLFNNMISSAKEYGATLNDIINATTDWVRAGFDANTSLGLAEVTTMYQHISDLDYDTAAENLITAYNGFKDELNGAFNGDQVAAVNYIADIFNELDNNFAVTSAGLGEALTRSASALDLAGNTIQETAGMVTGITEVTQDPEKAGSALKVLSLRLRGMKGQLEELGEETDENVENISKMQGQILNMTGGKVNIFDASGNFKSTYEIMKGIAEVWDDLSSIDQANLLETIAGKHRANDVAALLSNWENVEAAVKSASEAEGSATRENAKYVDSIQGRLDKMTTSWQSFANTFMSSDFLKGAISALTSFIEGLEKVIDTVGTFPALMGTIATGFSLFKNGGIFKTLTSDLDGFINKIGIANRSFADLINVFNFGKTSGGLKGGLSAIKNSLSDGLTKSDISNIQAYNKEIRNGTSAQTAWYRTMQTSSKSAQNLVASAKGSEVALNGMKAATIGSKVALIGAKVAAVAFNAALTMGISLLIDWAVSGIQKLINAKKELAESVEEITSKFKEQSDSLKKLKGDYDTSNESSMISKYEKLSKGVDGLGRNVSLTADEYSEYQSIVNQIAEQIPSLVSGYDSQGNALLSCKGNVEELTSAYEKLIKAQNNEVFKNVEDIGKDFKNSVDNADNSDFWNNEITSSDIEHLKTMLNGKYTQEEIEKYINNNAGKSDGSIRTHIQKALEGQGVDVGWFSSDVDKSIADTIKSNPEIIQRIIDDFENDLEEATAGMKTIAQATLSDAFDIRSSEYYDMSDTLQSIAKNIVNGFDFDFYKQYKDNPLGVQTYINDMLDQLNSLSEYDNAQIEAIFDLQTQFNNGEVTYGEYTKGIQKAKDIIDGLDLDDEVKNTIKLSLDDEDIKTQYNHIRGYLRDFYTNKDTRKMDRDEEYDYKFKARENDKKVEEFLNSLTSDELAAVIDIKAEIDWENTSAEDIRKQIEEQAKLNEALNFEVNIEADTTALETLNDILAESASAMGLSSEAIDSLKAKYADLDSFDPSTLFEATGNGVKVNREELEKLEKEYNDLTKTKVKEHLDILADKYNDVTAEIDKCTNAGERAELLAERETYADKIEELATYQAQLEGVTGAYQDWINAQNTPEDYEGYESVATSREDIEDEIDRGFIGNSTKKYIDLLSGEDLDGKSVDDYAEAWEKLDKKVTGAGYSVNDFFTVNDDGDITSTGIDRFFKSLQTDFEGSVAKFDDKTKKWSYDFGAENLEKIKEKWGIGIEAIELLLEAAASAGYDIDWDGILDGIDLDTSNFETLVSTAEAAQTAFNKLEGVEDVNFNFTATGVEEATSELEKARSTYIDLITNKDGTINLNAKGAEEMRVILATLLIQKQQLEDSNIAINIDTSGLDKSQQDIANAINAVKNFREKYKNLEIAVTTGQGIEEAKTELNTAMTELQGLGDAGVDIAAELILGEGATAESLNSKVDAAISAVGSKDIKVGCKLDETAIGTLNSQVLANFTPEATVKITGIDDSLVGEYTATEKTANGKVKWNNDTSLVVEFQSKTHKAKGIVDWANNVEKVKTKFSAAGTVKWTSGNNVKVKVISEANGTANANGTTGNFGRAFKHGDWGIKGSGTALVGELGMETLVRGGHFYTIGNSGAEFIKYKQGDIIFNHKQTEELFKNGKVTSDGGRGRMFADGSAFVDGSYLSNGRAFWQASASSSNFVKNRLQQVTADGDKAKAKAKAKDTLTKTQTKTKNNSVTTEVKTTWGANASESNFSQKRSNDSTNTDKKEFEEIFDWIEVAIERIEREIDNLDRTANSAYKSWSERNKALANEISKVSEEIKLQNNAATEYLKKANSVGLVESWAKKVRNGAIDIDTLNQDNSNEELVEKIKNYQKWYELYLDCIDAAEELREEEAKLYEQRFENVQSRYDGILQGFEHTESMLNEYISQAEAKGNIVSKNYYNALIDNEEDRIQTLKQEQIDLLKKRDEFESSLISKGATIEEVHDMKSWRDMCAEIDGVTQEIEAANTATIEWANNIRDIDWEIFDLIQQRITDITDEADFLIELMSNQDLFDDNGKFTKQGTATVGLHAQNYNTYMYQADLAGEEAAKLKQQLAANPDDTTNLEEQYRQRIAEQREYILAAEDAKNAIIDLVEEGINLEIEALDEKIQKYQDALDAQKDLYDYQKRVEEQTKEISSLQKQISAYEGDNSEETKAKIQELKVSLEEAEADLEETEYDKYITDQQKLLDSLYTEYESMLNERLDRSDDLVRQVIESINATTGENGYVTSALGADGAIATALGGNAATIKETIEKEATNVGAKLSDAMNNIWNLGEQPVLTMYGEGFQNKQTTTNSVLGGIKISVDSMVASLNKEAAKKTTANKTSTSAQKNPTTTTNKNNSNTANNTSSNSNKITEDTLKSIAAAIWVHGSKAGWEDDPTRKNKLSAKLGAANAKKVQEYINKYGANGELYRYWYSNNKSLDKYKYSAFKFGAKKIDESQLAWTQEAGQEYIVRPSDGAILTPVAKGDSVLTAQASNNIWQMANSPAEFIKDNLNLGSASVPNNSTVQNSYTQHIDSVVFRMDNVKNYEQLLSAMQKDKNFERLITAMTIDKLSGGSSLAKGKAIR